MSVDSRTVFMALVVAVAAARLVELRLARHNARKLRRHGAVEAGAGHYPWMVALHAAFLVAAPLEVFVFDRPWIPALASVSAIVFAIGMATRYWVIRTLGERWTTRVLAVPGAPLVTRGPYRFLRHPNYAAVALEIAALPLVHSAWLTSIVFTVANAALLRVRIGVEEEALAGAVATLETAEGGP